MKILITGGHHTSALPVIDELKTRQPDTKFYWVGHRHSILGDKNDTLEYKEITSLSIPFFELHAGKVYKTKSISRLIKIPLGFFHAFILVNKIKPDVILSFGGYLAAPIVFAGFVFGIRILTHEQTTVLGYANKFISNYASKILLTWESSKKYFPNKDVVVTGLPLRKDIFEVKSNNFELNPNLPTIYITCGKTGSHIINRVVLGSLEDLLSSYNVIHQCGDTSFNNDYEILHEKYQKLKVSGKYHLRKFVMSDEIGEAFTKANLVLGRSGAHTIYELLALKKNSVLIPIPWVSHNEQMENAKMLASFNKAIILEEKDLNSKSLLEALNLASKLPEKSNEIHSNIILNAEKRIVDEILHDSPKK